MRTNIEIDDALMTRAMETSGIKTKKRVVEEGLKALIQSQAAASILALRGTVEWDGDLNDMRLSKHDGQYW